MGILRVLSRNGDDETSWDESLGNLDVAEAVFNKLRREGYSAFARTDEGHKRITDFNAEESEIIMVRPLVGG